MEGRVQDISHQGALAAAGHAGHHGERIQRELDVYVLEIVLHGALNGNGVPPGVLFPHIGFADALQVLKGEGTLRLLRAFLPGHALKHHFSPVQAGFRPQVYEAVRGADNLRVVLYHHHGVADIPQAFENGDQPFGIPRVQADGGFVQDIHGAHQGAAEGRYQVHALAFTAGERIHGAGQGQVSQSHIFNALEAVLDFLDGLARHFPLPLRQRGRCEPAQKLFHRHRQEVVDGFSRHFHVQGFLAQAASSAGVAGGAAAVAA